MNPISPTLLFRSAVVLLTALALQSSVFSWFTVVGVRADLMLALTIAAGVVGGPQRGAVTGFAAGLVLDLLLFTPFGLSALTYCLVGYGVGLASALRIRQSRAFPLFAGLVGGAVGVLAFAALGELVGQPLLAEPDLVPILVVEAVGCALLTPPLTVALRWAWRPTVDSGVVLL
jgi:rod shape-determining protein MreD